MPSLFKIEISQESTSGPLLFLIFINDLPSATNFTTKLFADDTCLSLSRDNAETLNFEADIELN